MNLEDLPSGRPVFIDSNIFLYSIVGHPRFGPSCLQFFRRLESGEVDGRTSAFVLGEVYHKLLLADARRTLGVPMDRVVAELKRRPEAIPTLTAAREQMEIVRGYGIPVLPVPDFRAVVAASMAYGLLSTDSAHVAAMEATGIADIATNDRDFFRVGTLRIWAPSQSG